MKLIYIILVPIFMLAHGGEVHDKKMQSPKKIEKEETINEKVEETTKKNIVNVYTQINKEYINTIKPIFETKCFNCHSNKTKEYWYSDLPVVSTIIKNDIKEAKKHLDFSNDFPFISHDTPQNDLISILKVFEDGTMPPFKYKIMHSESKISKNDIKKVKKWVENSLPLLKKE